VTSLAAVLLFLAGCEDPPQDSVQRGYRGVGMVQHYSPEEMSKLLAQNQVPDAPDPASAAGPKAKDVYENVEVLGDLSQAQFLRFMSGITNWVSPEQGCAYCHNLQEGFQYEDVYTKQVSRNMIKMTRALNSEWESHTLGVNDDGAGVTCYTCHKGNNLPQNIWYEQTPDQYASRMVGNRMGQNRPSPRVAMSSLPGDPFETYFQGDKEIRVQGQNPLPRPDSNVSIKQTEHTYGLMHHMSDSLGVNCTYCHNSRNWYDWEESTPQRVNAWYGIEMVRDINNKWITPITDWFPEKRKGPMGDIGKVNCTTCHQGVYKPLFGANMLKDYPSLDPNGDGIGPGKQPDEDTGDGQSAEAIGPVKSTPGTQTATQPASATAN
jgi:photosynthetic reaction center cytochrome c subunit